MKTTMGCCLVVLLLGCASADSDPVDPTTGFVEVGGRVDWTCTIGKKCHKDSWDGFHDCDPIPVPNFCQSGGHCTKKCVIDGECGCVTGQQCARKCSFGSCHRVVDGVAVPIEQTCAP